jgi:O-antigen/teichoic acid export membrane protein
VLPFSQAWGMVPSLIYSSVLPRLSALYVQNVEQYNLRLQQLFSILVWGGVGAGVVTVLIAPLVVRLLLGHGYEPAITVLQVHVFSNVFVFLGVAQSVTLINQKNATLALYKTLLGLLASVGMNFLLIPRYGAMGAACSAIFAQFVSAMLSNLLLDREVLKMQCRAFWMSGLSLRWARAT